MACDAYRRNSQGISFSDRDVWALQCWVLRTAQRRRTVSLPQNCPWPSLISRSMRSWHRRHGPSTALTSPRTTTKLSSMWPRKLVVLMMHVRLPPPGSLLNLHDLVTFTFPRSGQSFETPRYMQYITLQQIMLLLSELVIRMPVYVPPSKWRDTCRC